MLGDETSHCRLGVIKMWLEPAPGLPAVHHAHDTPPAAGAWASATQPIKAYLACTLSQASLGVGIACAVANQGGASHVQDVVVLLIAVAAHVLSALEALLWRPCSTLLLGSLASSVLLTGASIVASVAGIATPAAAACSALAALLLATSLWFGRLAHGSTGWRQAAGMPAKASAAVGTAAGMPAAESQEATLARQQQRRRNRFRAVGRLDMQLLVLLCCVAIVNGASPAGQQLVPLLIAAGAVGLPLLAGLLLSLWCRHRLSLDLVQPLALLPPLLVIFAALDKAGQLTQAHGQAYLVIFSLLFLACRSAAWWASKSLGRQQPQRHVAAAAQGEPLPAHAAGPLPAELQALAVGAWLLKIRYPRDKGSWTIAAASNSTTRRQHRTGANGSSGGHWRFFKLSPDGTLLQWDTHKYLLLTSVRSIDCCEADQTIHLSLALEQDLILKCPSADSYHTWSAGLGLLLKLLLLPVPLGLAGNHGTISHQATVDSNGNGAGPPAQVWPEGSSMQSQAVAAQKKGWKVARLVSAALSRPRRACSRGIPHHELTAARSHVRTALVLAAEDAAAASKLQQRPPGPASFSLTATAGASQLAASQDAALSQEAAGVGAGQPGWLNRAVTLPAHVFRTLSGSQLEQQQAGSRGSLSSRQGAGASMSVPGGNRSSPSRELLRGNLQQTSSKGDLQELGEGGEGGAAVPQLAEEQQWQQEERHLPQQAWGQQQQQQQQQQHESSNHTPHAASPGCWADPASAAPGSAAQVEGPAGAQVQHMAPPQQQQEQQQPVSFSLPSGQLNTTGYAGMSQHQTQLPPLNTRARSWHHRSGSLESVPSTPQPQFSQLQPQEQQQQQQQQSYQSYIQQQLLMQQRGRGSRLHDGGGSMGSAQSSPLRMASRLPSMSGCAALTPHALSRFESLGGYSSWGLPTPTTAKATAFSPTMAAATGGLSRAESLLAGANGFLWQQQLQRQTGSPGGMQAQGGMQVQSSSSSSPQQQQQQPRLLLGPGLSISVELLNYEDLIIGKLLGEGSEGAVYAAYNQESPCAVKQVQSMREVEMHAHAGSAENIVALRGVAQRDASLYLVMEFCARGTLDQLIHHKSSHMLDPMKLLPLVRSIARGMYHLHSRCPPVLHRDLKSANVFLGHGFVPKIGDFGMSRVADHGAGGTAAYSPSLRRKLSPGVVGTAAYAAPELLSHEDADSNEGADVARLLKADVYSFGVLLWELLERRRPHAGLDGFQISATWLVDPDSMRLPAVAVPPGLAPTARMVLEALANLVQSCTALDPDARPTFKAILEQLKVATTGGSDGEGRPLTPAASFSAAASAALPMTPAISLSPAPSSLALSPSATLPPF